MQLLDFTCDVQMDHADRALFMWKLAERWAPIPLIPHHKPRPMIFNPLVGMLTQTGGLQVIFCGLCSTEVCMGGTPPSTSDLHPFTAPVLAGMLIWTARLQHLSVYICSLSSPEPCGRVRCSCERRDRGAQTLKARTLDIGLKLPHRHLPQWERWSGQEGQQHVL